MAPEHTHWPTDPAKMPDTLDFFAFHELNDLYCSTDTCHEINGNHISVVLGLDNVSYEGTVTPVLINKYRLIGLTLGHG